MARARMARPGKAKVDWDAARASALVGKHVVLGVTVYGPDRVTVETMVERHGRVTEVDPDIGITVTCEGEHAGQKVRLPPSLDALKPADAGLYRLKSTGEVVENPDLVGGWAAVRPAA